MIRSEALDALSVALSEAQGEFEAVSKTAANPFFKSRYAALPDVVKAATPILAKHGLAVWQAGDTDETGEVLWTVVLHKSGQYLGSAARLLPVKGDPQAQGSAITYQRRYQYMSALGLVADDDDDGNAASRPRPKPAPARKPVPMHATTSVPATGSPAAETVQPKPKAPEPKLGQDVLDHLRTVANVAGVAADAMAWHLLSVGVETLPENPTREDIGAAMRDLSLEQALKLESLLNGEDESLPGTGETA